MSNRLENFKKVANDTWNFRCPICGDSETHKHKSRGYFVRKNDNMIFFCHNSCGGMSFPNFLKRFDPNLHDQYLLQKYKKAPDMEEEMRERFKAPPFQETMQKYFDQLGSMAVSYLQDRKIHFGSWLDAGLYQGTSSQIARFMEEVLGKPSKLEGNDLRIVFPFTDRQGGLVGVSGRTIEYNKMRWMTAMPSDHDKAAFQLHAVDMTKDVYVLEGQFDCLSVPNSISPGGLSKFPFVDLPKDKRIFVVDNEPRAKDVCKMLQRLIDDDERVVIWHPDLEPNDPNEMVEVGLNPLAEMQGRIFQGLKAQLEFTQWRKV